MSTSIDPRLPLTAEVRRIATQEIETALDLLAAAPGADADRCLHECRKRLKAVRALLRLVRSGDEPFARAENGRYRDAAALLAGPREAAAMLETMERLEREFPDKTAGGALDRIREAFAARRKQAVERDAGKAINEAARACRTGLARIGHLQLPDDPEMAADILADGVRKTIGRGRKSLEKARTRGDANDFHDLRKAVKTYSRHLSLLKKHWPTPVRQHRKALDALGERLGELHDLVVLRRLLDDDGATLADRAAARLLDRLAKRSQRRHAKACLAKAADLLGASGKSSARKVARAVRSKAKAGQAGAASMNPGDD